MAVGRARLAWAAGAALWMFVGVAVCLERETIDEKLMKSPANSINVFELDMNMTVSEFYTLKNRTTGSGGPRRSAPIRANHLWPSGVIPYTIDNTLNTAQKTKIMAAMKEWATGTCIQFIPKTTETVFVTIKSGTSCTSKVGRQTGSIVTFNPTTCFTDALILHELGHVIGLYHQHDRPDRDTYVTIYLNNVAPANYKEFLITTYATVDLLNTPYDYQSIMHYGAKAFSNNGRDTIVPKNPTLSALIGRASRPSQLDIVAIQKMYQCSGPICSDQRADCATFTRRMACTTAPAMAMCRKFCKVCTANVCPANYCNGKGKCVAGNLGNPPFRCECSAGFTGARCGRDVCTPNPCQNGGICLRVAGPDIFTCNCKLGFAASRCQRDLCNPNPCGPGTCRKIINGYECMCPNGKKQLSCPVRNPCEPTNPCGSLICTPTTTQASGYACSAPQPGRTSTCYPNPCNGGLCSLNTLGPSCTCPPLQTGSRCELNSGFCSTTSACSNVGACIVTTFNRYRCTCPVGRKGVKCENAECAASLCSGGTCSRRILTGVQSCECPPGRTGATCATLTNPCLPNPCGTGTCAAAQVPPGYTCTSRPTSPQNPCYPNPCNGGRCTPSSSNTPMCSICPNHFTGSRCQTLQIASCLPSPCGRGRCGVVTGGVACTCPVGYSGATCADTTVMCTPNPCNGGVCRNRNGVVLCECPLGKSGFRCQTSVCTPNPCGTRVCVPDNTPTGYSCVSNTNPCIPNPCNGGRCTPGAANTQTCDCSTAPNQFGARCQYTGGLCNPDPCRGFPCSLVPGGRECRCGSTRTGANCQLEVCPAATCNGGSCTRDLATNIIKCECQTGRVGPRCATSSGPLSIVTSCTPNPCKNGANCLSSSTTGNRCVCATGFNGVLCDKTGPQGCLPNPCRNNGQCRATANGFVCDCINNWFGKICTAPFLGCHATACHNNGRCVLQTTPYCVCPGGYRGPLCDYFQTCGSASCTSNGRCVTTVNGYVCQCNSGFVGQRCETFVSPQCATKPCYNGGKCITVGSSYRCECLPGYHGPLCQSISCTPNPCNGGGCTKFGDTIHCACAGSQTGPYCQYGGTCTATSCLNGGVCSSTPTGRACRCAIGYRGTTCQFGSCIPNPCNQGTCGVTQTGFNCDCPTGITGTRCAGGQCATNPCLNGGVCVPRAAPATVPMCRCATGYSGPICASRNPCSPNPCLAGGTCAAVGINFRCTCIGGRTGLRCETVGPINLCTGINCPRGFTCTAASGAPVCIPAPNQCSTARCPAGSQCVLVSNIVTCQPITTGCQSTGCLNGGVCSRGVTGQFTCTCPSTFTGVRCEIAIQRCTPNPCQNGGLCTPLGNAVRCTCPTGFTGNLCQIPSCLPNPCQNGGVCSIVGTTRSCFCTATFTGPLCRTPTSLSCLANPCLNGGVCSVSGTTRTCTCLQGFTGQLCQTRTISACTPNPCQVNARCLLRAPGSVPAFTCLCPPGRSGPICQNMVDLRRACTAATCRNGGLCINLPNNNYRCLCIRGFSGRNCQTL